VEGRRKLLCSGGEGDKEMRRVKEMRKREKRNSKIVEGKIQENGYL
jgi:hypothetical protein